MRNEPLRKCRICGKEAYSESDLSLFAKRKDAKYGRLKVCNKCESERNIKRYHSTPLTKEKSRENKNKNLRQIYGITVDCYDKLYIKQNGRCLICGNKYKKLFVDHNHKNNEIRGLLCPKCNTGLGHFGDNPEIIKKAVLYLEEYGYYSQKNINK